MLGCVYVTNQAVKLAVTFRRPTRKLASQGSDSAKQVEPSYTSDVTALHEKTCSVFGKLPPVLGLFGVSRVASHTGPPHLLQDLCPSA